jgi:aldehyde dehydrogenase (NAD+)
MVFLNSFTKEVNEIIKTIVSETFLPELVVCFNNSDVPYDELLKPNFDYVFFTGSENVGKIVATKCGEKLIPYTLELGGKCPVLVLEDADVEIAAKRIVRGKLFNSGQTCVAPDYVYVHKNVYDDFVVALKKYIELYQNDTTELTKFVSPKHFERIRSLLQNQEIILEGEVDEKNLVASLTVIRTEENSPVMQEEIFGPILPLIVYEDLGEKLNILRTAKSPLALYVFSSSKQRYNSILRMLKCGTSC